LQVAFERARDALLVMLNLGVREEGVTNFRDAIERPPSNASKLLNMFVGPTLYLRYGSPAR
jgi:hypothetical protein